MRVLAQEWLSWLKEVWGAKPSTIRDYSFLLREPGEAFKRGPGKTAGRIMKAFGDRPAAELAPHRDAVIATVAKPDHRGSDPRPARERYWRRGLGPSRWLMVVVDFDSVPARVVTAYGNRKDPPGWTP